MFLATVAECSRSLGVSRSRIIRLIEDGKIVGDRGEGKRLKFRLEEVRRAVEESSFPPSKCPSDEPSSDAEPDFEELYAAALKKCSSVARRAVKRFLLKAISECQRDPQLKELELHLLRLYAATDRAIANLKFEVPRS